MGPWNLVKLFLYKMKTSWNDHNIRGKLWFLNYIFNQSWDRGSKNEWDIVVILNIKDIKGELGRERWSLLLSYSGHVFNNIPATSNDTDDVLFNWSKIINNSYTSFYIKLVSLENVICRFTINCSHWSHLLVYIGNLETGDQDQSSRVFSKRRK